MSDSKKKKPARIPIDPPICLPPLPPVGERKGQIPTLGPDGVFWANPASVLSALSAELAAVGVTLSEEAQARILAAWTPSGCDPNAPASC